MKRKKMLVLGGLALLVIVAGTSVYFRRTHRMSGDFKTFKVGRGDLSITVLSTGTVEPENRLNIQSPIAGRAEQVLVDQGYRVKKGQILVWASSTERAALMDGARSVSPEEVKKWEELYKPTPVMAPVAGMIIQRNIQPGQTFATTDAILVMSDHLIVQAQVDETDIAQIRLKQVANITLDAYPNDLVPGHVDKIAYDAKTVNNVTTYEVDVLPEKVPGFMRSGMTANVSFPVGSKTDVLIVPADAVKTRNGRPYVLVLPPSGGEPTRRDVTLGISDGKRVEIASGLTEGEPVLEPEFKPGGNRGHGAGSNPFAPSSTSMSGRH